MTPQDGFQLEDGAKKNWKTRGDGVHFNLSHALAVALVAGQVGQRGQQQGQQEEAVGLGRWGERKGQQRGRLGAVAERQQQLPYNLW